MQEPFVDVILELTWSTGRLVREYTLLFDPPAATARAPAAPAPAAAPAMFAAPAPAPASHRRCPSAGAPRQARGRSRLAPREPRAPRTAGCACRCRRAGTGRAPTSTASRPATRCTRIASRTQRAGVSLDQMLVSLYRGNPQAFVDNNMNRLKSGVVLSVPSAESAQGTSPSEARQVIQAQSADFGAYRQRLAGAVPAAKTEGRARQASGKVQASVEDRKRSAAPTPDKLTLSKGAAAGEACRRRSRRSRRSARRRTPMRAWPNCRRTSRS